MVHSLGKNPAFPFAVFAPFALFALKSNDVHNQSAPIFAQPESGPTK
jgi:hypothetical protein